MADYCILDENSMIENIIVIDDPEMVEYFHGHPVYVGRLLSNADSRR